MARAFVTVDFSAGDPRPTATADEFQVDLPVVFLGSDLPAALNGVDKSIVTITLGFGDSLATMANKVGAAVRAQAAAFGYSVGQNSVLVSSLSKV